MQVSYQNVTFELSQRQDTPLYFVLGVRKSGSSILNSMMTALAGHNGKTFVDIPGQLFKAGVRVKDWQHDGKLGTLFHGGNVYGGFRNAPLGVFELAAFRSARKILMVRDPRDALVSEYFSNAYSHSLPAGGKGLEGMQKLRQEALASSLQAYVLERAQELSRTMMEYAPLVQAPNTRVFRYEDVILHKRELLVDICRHFGWPVDEPFMQLVLGWADVVPGEERPEEFVRRVVPGDHREKLSADAIRQLDELLQAPMRAFGYSA
ncbi:MAG TPA: sulfotransferase domain-containing protein [Ideonella sp.]|jgi:hypothetical protein|nr:sulfotransferase domain-containing protein [Ideonella sp.]